MMDALRPAFADVDMHVEDICWDDETVDWADFDAAIIGTTWDYWDRQGEYLDKLAEIGSVTKLWNSLELIGWNIDKGYLRKLADKGASIIPTLWVDNPTSAAITAAFDHFATDDLVVKRQVGGSSTGQHRIRRGEAIPELTQPMMAQPFQPAITTEGEYSFIFVDGALSHSLNKRPADGDYRIQSEYGGTEEQHQASVDDVEAAVGIISLLDEVPLYARVDMLRLPSGSLALMEMELIEPYLYPEQGPELGPLIAAAVKCRLSS